MRELKLNEIESINGGNPLVRVVIKIGKAVKAFVSDRVVQATAAGGTVGYLTSQGNDKPNGG